MKKQNGITLIALIITIIVLLILAVVTIGAVQDSGIIKYAKMAANKSKIAQLEEEIRLIIAEKNMDIKANPTKYTNIESDYNLSVDILEILRENFEVSNEYVIDKLKLGEDVVKDFLILGKIKNDPTRYKEIVSENSREYIIPCIYKEYPVDITVKVINNGTEDKPEYNIVNFDFIYTSNISLVEVASTVPDIKVDENIVAITDDGIPIPKGFEYVSGTRDTGVIIKNLQLGAEFVWVPVPVNPKFNVTVNAVEDEIKTVQILNTEGLDKTFEVNSEYFNKTYDLTRNGAFEVIVTYKSGKVEDKIHIIDQVYSVQSPAIKMLEAAFEVGLSGFYSFEEYADYMINESDSKFSSRIDFLTKAALQGVSMDSGMYKDNIIIEKDSVMKYGGFYIGRVEQNSSNISYEGAVAEIEYMNNQYKDYVGVKATLPSGAAWDRIGVWLTETSKLKFNVYLDCDDWANNKGSDGNSYNYYANNIYKLVGGYEEWTTAQLDGKNVLRGSHKEDSSPTMLDYSTDDSNYKGYRMLLYINE